MVCLNNMFAGNNNPVVDAYFRNLHELRTSIEIALLPIPNYLVTQTEGHSPLLPSILLEHDGKYLKTLGERYHKRDFTITRQTIQKDLIYPALLKLIHKTKKYISYSLNDLFDLLNEHGTQLSVEIPHNLLLPVKIVTNIYNKKIPPQLNNLFKDLKEHTICGTVTAAHKQKRKYSTSFQLYAAILQNIKIALDLEILKIYDFLLESKQKIFKSDALLAILPEIHYLGETEYAKQPFSKKIIPLGTKKSYTKNDREHLFLEEWSSNIRRAIELKTLLAHDFYEYVQQEKQIQIPLEEGYYPELTMLLENVFKKPLKKIF